MEGRLLSGPIPGHRRAVGVGEWRGGSHRVPYLDTDGQWEWENGGEAPIGPPYLETDGQWEWENGGEAPIGSHTWTQTGSGSVCPSVPVSAHRYKSLSTLPRKACMRVG